MSVIELERQEITYRCDTDTVLIRVRENPDIASFTVTARIDSLHAEVTVSCLVGKYFKFKVLDSSRRVSEESDAEKALDVAIDYAKKKVIHMWKTSVDENWNSKLGAYEEFQEAVGKRKIKEVL